VKRSAPPTRTGTSILVREPCQPPFNATRSATSRPPIFQGGKRNIRQRRLSDQRDNGYTASSLPHGLTGLAAPKRSLSLTSDARHGPGFRRLFEPNAGLRLITRNHPKNFIITSNLDRQWQDHPLRGRDPVTSRGSDGGDRTFDRPVAGPTSATRAVGNSLPSSLARWRRFGLVACGAATAVRGR
jgi:hypothetical protein